MLLKTEQGGKMKILFTILILFIIYVFIRNIVLYAMIKDLNLEIHGINKKLLVFEDGIQLCIDKINKILGQIEKH